MNCNGSKRLSNKTFSNKMECVFPVTLVVCVFILCTNSVRNSPYACVCVGVTAHSNEALTYSMMYVCLWSCR